MIELWVVCVCCQVFSRISGLVSVLQEDVEASGEEGDSVARQILLLSLLMEVSFDS